MKAIEQLQKELAKKGFNVKLASELKQEEKLRTGIMALDDVLDGGISICEGGHRIELFGAEAAGKTTVALHIIKKFQQLKKVCAFIDAEMSYDKDWAENIGIDNDALIVIQPNSLEDFGNLLVDLLPTVDLVVIDSVVGLIPEGESERETAEPQMALSARVNALITRKIYHALGEHPVTMIFINQLREKVGVMYGNPYTTGGGRALKHLYNTRIEFKTGKLIESGTGEEKENVGIEIRLHGVKNKKGKPYRKAEFDLYFNGTIDNKKSLFYTGLRYGLIERAGNTYTFGEIKGIGQEKFKEEMKDTDWKSLEDRLMEKLK